MRMMAAVLGMILMVSTAIAEGSETQAAGSGFCNVSTVC